MRSIMAMGLLLATAGMGLSAKAVDMVGVTTMTIDAPDSDRALSVTLWYPAKAGGTSVRIGESAVFEGVEGRQDAPIADGAFPIILVSHGSIRAAPDHSNWIASRLAARGAVAAVVRGPTLGPRDAAIAMHEIWRRPADLGATLSALVNDPKWSGHLDQEEIGAVGFFLGVRPCFPWSARDSTRISSWHPATRAKASIAPGLPRVASTCTASIPKV